MINKIKKYLEYRRNRRIAKRELAKMAATTLPVIREVSSKGADIAKFTVKLVDESKSLKDEQLISMVLDKVADVLKTDNNRIIEILSYMVNLSQEDIQKILVHSLVETIPDKKEENE